MSVITTLPPGARMVPWHFFAEDMPVYELREWEVWLGGDLWSNVLSLTFPPTNHAGWPSLDRAPNGLRVVARAVTRDYNPPHEHRWLDGPGVGQVIERRPGAHCHRCGVVAR